MSELVARIRPLCGNELKTWGALCTLDHEHQGDHEGVVDGKIYTWGNADAVSFCHNRNGDLRCMRSVDHPGPHIASVDGKTLEWARDLPMVQVVPKATLDPNRNREWELICEASIPDELADALGRVAIDAARKMFLEPRDAERFKRHLELWMRAEMQQDNLWWDFVGARWAYQPRAVV